MKIYLAARYGRKEQLIAVRSRLRDLGHVVTSRWLDTDWGRHPDDNSSAAPQAYRAKYCLIDLEDVLAADCLISFTEDPEEENVPGGRRGGRHVEYGVALHAGRRLIIVGHRENLFHHHPSVEYYPDEDSALQALNLVVV